MLPLLIIGLLWLSVTAVLCLLIGRAIRDADRHEEELTQRAWAARRGALHPGRGLRERRQATPWAPASEQVLRPGGIPRAGGRSRLVFRSPDSDAPPTDVPGTGGSGGPSCLE